jgi:hypothetical protein
MEQLPQYVVHGGCDYLLYGLVKSMMAGDFSKVNELKTVPQASQDAAMKAAAQEYLPSQVSYEQALWRCYPTPLPTMAPRIDTDTDISLFSSMD